jgi:bacteriorhodopsin
MSDLAQFNQVIFPTALTITFFQGVRPDYEDLWWAELWILGIASLSYLLLSQVKDLRQREDIRYIDWLLTTPALVFLYWRFAQINGWQESFEGLFSATLVMVAAGYLAKREEPIYAEGEQDLRPVFLGISFLALLFIFSQVRLISEFLENRGIQVGIIPWFFYLGWSYYGLAFFLPLQLREEVFSILDLINKVIFAFVFNLLLLP